MRELNGLVQIVEEAIPCARCGSEATVRMYPGYLCAACALATPPPSDTDDRPAIVCDRCDSEASVRVGSGFMCSPCALEASGMAEPGLPLLADLYVDALLRIERLEQRVGHQALELEEGKGRLRRSDQGRRAALRRLLEVQEEERHILADDLHDDALQVMATVSMRLDALKRIVDDPVGGWRFRELENAVRSAVDRLRFLASGMRSQVLEREGLRPAIERHLREAEAQFGLTCRLDYRLAEDPQPQVATIMFRIAQEAVTNARKHARASKVIVTLEERDAGFLLRVRDDGVGFGGESQAEDGPNHFGLASMRERAELAGGWFRLKSRPGMGTTVRAFVPGDREAGSAAS
jgi:signal transduction histidine kinase